MVLKFGCLGLVLIMGLLGSVALAVEPAPSGFLRSLDTVVPPASASFSPLSLPCGSRIRGLSLSGEAIMKKTDGAGAMRLKRKSLNWASRYLLQDGCTLLHAQEPTVVDAGPAQALIGKDTTAVVHTAHGSTRFVNLTDHARGGMLVFLGQKAVELAPGREIVFVYSDNPNAREVAVQEGIGWKDMQQLKLKDMYVFVFSVSAKDIMKRCTIYRQLNTSSLPVDHRLRDELVKTVAALEQMYDRHNGPYPVNSPYLYGAEGKPRPSKSQPVQSVVSNPN